MWGKVKGVAADIAGVARQPWLDVSSGDGHMVGAAWNQLFVRAISAIAGSARSRPDACWTARATMSSGYSSGCSSTTFEMGAVIAPSLMAAAHVPGGRDSRVPRRAAIFTVRSAPTTSRSWRRSPMPGPSRSPNPAAIFLLICAAAASVATGRISHRVRGL